MSFTFSTAAHNFSSSLVGSPIWSCEVMMLSPSLRSPRCCHNSSVMNGMNGWSIWSKVSKKWSVAS